MPGFAVVDVSVAVKWLFQEPGSDQANLLREEWIKNEIVPCAPEFLLIELHNVVWKKIQRAVLKPDDAILQTSPAFGLDLNWLPTRPLLPQALQQAIQQKISVYDAIYVALAQAMQATFHTADKALASKLQGTSTLVQVVE